MKRDSLLNEYNNMKKRYENIFEANVKLVDENKELKEIIIKLEEQLKNIYELYYDNKSEEEIEKWIEEVKNEIRIF